MRLIGAASTVFAVTIAAASFAPAPQAEQQSTIDALTSGDGELADDDGYQAALDQLPDERLAFGWVSKGALPSNFPKLQFDWLAGSIEARDDGASATFVERLTDTSP